jgi:hypothetical protein
MSIDEFFDDNIPNEVLHDSSWQPRLMPDLNDLAQPHLTHFTYDDLLEDFE